VTAAWAYDRKERDRNVGQTPRLRLDRRAGGRPRWRAPRWRQRKTSFTKFIEDDIPIDSYTMRGRDVLNSDNLAAGDTRRRRHSYWLDLVDRSGREQL
jgi:hypothetical protein